MLIYSNQLIFIIIQTRIASLFLVLNCYEKKLKWFLHVFLLTVFLYNTDIINLHVSLFFQVFKDYLHCAVLKGYTGEGLKVMQGCM